MWWICILRFWGTRLLGAFLLAVSLNSAALFAQENSHNPESFAFSLDLSVNYLVLDSVPFLQFVLLPEFLFPRVNLAFAFFLPIEISDSWELRRIPYDSLEALFGKLDHLVYSVDEEALLFRVAPMENYTLGYGLILRHYANTLAYPEIRKLAFLHQMRYPGFSFDALIGDLLSQNLFAARVLLKPFVWGSGFSEVLESLSFGFSFVGDFFPDRMLVVRRRLPAGNTLYRVRGEEDSRLAYGADFAVSVLRVHGVSVDFFVEYARMQKLGQAVGYGFFGAFWPGSVNLEYRVQLRHLFGNFLPEYFNVFYDVFRGNYDALLQYPRFSWYLQLRRAFFQDRLVLFFSYDALLSGHFRPHIRVEVQVKRLWDNFSLAFYYDHFYFLRDAPLSQSLNSWIAFELFYSLNEFLEVACSVKKAFVLYESARRPDPFWNITLFSSFRFS